MSFARQRGAYADNLYPGINSTALLTAVPGDAAAVLARPFDQAEASRRGVIIIDDDQMTGLVEKPDPSLTAPLLDLYGSHQLRLLEGRFELPHDLVRQLHKYTAQPGEPRPSLALAFYARSHPVHVVTTATAVLDVGVPGIPGSALHHSTTPRCAEHL